MSASGRQGERVPARWEALTVITRTPGAAGYDVPETVRAEVRKTDVSSLRRFSRHGSLVEIR